ncbi:hypothetical protein RDABS01_011189 [Bienertia sinuspersici]
MAPFRVTQALSKCKIARNSIMFRMLHNDSSNILSDVPKAGILRQTLNQNNATKIDPRTYQAPDFHPSGIQEASIGRNQQGSADVVMQTYGSWHKRSMTGGAAWIMQDDHLQVIHGGCLQNYGVSALQMEVLACFHGIEWARVHRFHNVSIYTNSCNLVQLLQGSIPLDIALISKIQEIRYQALLLNWCCVKKVPKSQVRHAFNAAVACRAGVFPPSMF